jgi:dihydropteroate synthase
LKLTIKDTTCEFSTKTYVMGILNVTPDSFSDGGRFLRPNDAIRQAMRMIQEGADIIDIGGESTRPGSDPVDSLEEIKRVIPVIKELSRLTTTPISIDTYKSEVAREALEAGASMINDISGLGFDSKMASLAAHYDVPVVLMHIKGRPKDMQKAPHYEAFVPEMLDYFRLRIRLALEAGIREDRIIIDPGIGFGKTFDHNLQLLRDLQEFKVFHRPILVGVSRKAFIGHLLGGLPADERLEGTIAATVVAAINGASIVRVHDVKETVRALRIADAIKRGRVAC